MGKIGKRKYIRQRTRKDPHLNPRQMAACYGKVRYQKTDKDKALAGRPDFVKFYKCDFCKFYHIGRRKEGKRGR